MPYASPPFAQPVTLRGKGPFQLPRMKAVLSFGIESWEWEWPVLRFETLHGAQVLVPLAAEAVNALKIDLQNWLKLPNNPVGE
ncbi:MAG: hypothetical protein ACREH9_13890 [Pseudomonadota bacterium]